MRCGACRLETQIIPVAGNGSRRNSRNVGWQLATGGAECEVTAGRKNDGRRGVWQPKFWEHTIVDEDDFENHFDYIHYNPVKHEYVRCPVDWPYSSFHRWVMRGVYSKHWGCIDRSPKPNFDRIEKTVGE